MIDIPNRAGRTFVSAATTNPPPTQTGTGGARAAEATLPNATAKGQSADWVRGDKRNWRRTLVTMSPGGHKSPDLLEFRRSDSANIEKIIDGSEPASRFSFREDRSGSGWTDTW